MGGSYRGREEQITWRAGTPSTGGGYKEGNQTGPRRDPNAIDIDRGREENKTCYVCGK